MNRLAEKIYGYEKYLFLIIALLNVLPVFTLNIIPSLDGPQHLYISNIIVNLIEGNEFVSRFFKINEVIVGNWIGHFLLSFYNLLFPAVLAEKLFISTYYLGIAFSFKYLITGISGKPSFLSFIIFPFSSTTLFVWGYYNFSIGIIVLFVVLTYWIKLERSGNLNIKTIFVLMALFLLLYLSHVFVFMLGGLVIGIHLITFYGLKSIKSSGRKALILSHLKKLFFVLIAALPSVALWLRYTMVVTDLGGMRIKQFSFGQLFEYLVTIRSLTALQQQREVPWNICLFVLINLVLLFSVIYRYLKYQKANSVSDDDIGFFRSSDFWLFISFVFLVLYFVFPDVLGSGNITNRISTVMFFLLIIWIAVQEIPRWISLMAAILFITIAINHRLVQYEVLSVLDKDFIELKELEDKIDENSTIVRMGTTGNWLQLHYCYYLGIDKSLVFLHNVQCEGQFPVVYNKEKIPPVHLGVNNIEIYKGEFTGVTSENYNEKIQFVDYFLVVMPWPFINAEENKSFYKLLYKYYDQHYMSTNKRYALYKFKAKDKIEEVIDKIKKDEQWLAKVKSNSVEKNIPLENMMILEAMYLLEMYY